MGNASTTPHGRPPRLASAFSALGGTTAAGLAVAGCLALAHAAPALLGFALPLLLVRVVTALLGVAAALLGEAGAFRLAGVRWRPRGPATAPAPRPDARLLLRSGPGRAGQNHVTHP
jgi:hypothetical protein